MVRLVCCLSFVTILSGAPAEWPGWRGDGTGVSPEKNLPTEWTANTNVRWHVALPGPGNSSPIVWADRVFITQAVKSENRRTVMCFNRADGKLLWQAGVTFTVKEQTQQANPYCSATPVTDGERVIASFGSAGLYCYDFAGKELWHRDFGTMTHMFGNASSPIIHGDLCIFHFGPDEKARLIAVNKRTGETVWEVAPRKVDPSEQQAMPGMPGGPGGPGRGPGGPGGSGGGRGGMGGTWSTPIVIKVDGHDELVAAFPNRLAAYDPKTGQQLWVSKGIGDSIYTTPLWGDGALVAMNGGPAGGSAVAVTPGGSGDVTESRRLWRLERVRSAIGSGVIHDGRMYLIGQDSTLECFDVKNGKLLWEGSLKAQTGKNITWASVLLADGKLYIPNQSGTVFVVKEGPKFELLASNSIGEPANGSLAASGGQFFLRTDKGLWCIGR